MKTETFWDLISGSWNSPSTEPGESDRRVMEKTISQIKPEDTLLDFGCANGALTMILAEKVHQILGIDISSRMIEIAERGKAEQGLTNITFRHAVLSAEWLRAQSFDVVTAFAVLHLVDDPAAEIRRIHGLLKPGGRFLSTTPCMGEKSGKNHFFTTALYLLSRVGILPRNIHFFKKEELVSCIVAQGFQVLEVELISTDLAAEYYVAAEKI